ncbi:hypothetical protein H0H81_011846 [Sphagnurus paluster]|uniref:DUF7082 domain-containing protein n=1 Tax=Sphagnurus paluster TaxID=117069 RepID=A0A9P7GUF0_9AGAR|nr:hypothetical protein H0H81_011846 [Sphagnurus paluster]
MQTSEKLAALEGQIQLLSDVHTRLQTLRQIPGVLLQGPGTAGLGAPTLRREFQQMKEIADTIRTEPVQEALRTARDSLESDRSDLNPNLRREKRKRRRAPSPESPRPYIGQEDSNGRVFPERTEEGLKIEGLAEYIQTFNREHEAKLHLWRRTRGGSEGTRIVRFVEGDVLTAYVTLVAGPGGVLLAESLATFAPREKVGETGHVGPETDATTQKWPHSQSDYGVYRSVSQQIAKMVETESEVTVQQIVGLLCAYQGLFVERCERCERVLSTEGHVPPIYASPIAGPLAAVVVSPSGILHVLGYTPAEGEHATPVSVRIHFQADYPEEIYVRLVVGTVAVATTVREIHDTSYGRWQLDALVPPFEQQNPSLSSTKVPLCVQALNKANVVLDSTTFGEFSYWAPGLSRHSPPLHKSLPAASSPRELPPSRKPKLQISTTTSPRVSQSLPQPSTFRRRGSNLPTPSPTSPARLRSASTASKSQAQVLHRRTKVEAIARPKAGKNGDSHLQTPILDLITPLQNICRDWTPAETAVGRRLVRFTKVQDGRRLIVSCEPIHVDDYRDSDSVISCIYREESSTCYVTSVDIIFLLERLTNSDFPVEEKNRIRRNLEGLRPTTVSKHKHGFEDFFQRIMEFPDPKPRNIEKDLKVFEWSLLDQALDKILSKYTIDTSSMPEEPESSSSAEPSPSTSSEDADYDLAYPPNVKLEDAYIDESPLQTPIHDEFPYLTSSDGSDSLCSPLAAPSTTYQLYNNEIVSTEAGTSNPNHWSEYKTVDMTLDHYAAYEVAQQGTPIINYPDVDFSITSPYDTTSAFYHNSDWS